MEKPTYGCIVAYSLDEKAKKKAEIVQACRDGVFTFTEACIVAGIHRYTAWLWMQDDEEFRAEWDKAKEQAYDERLDYCERMLMKNVEKGDNSAIFFFMKTQGKPRGYNEKIDISHQVTHTIDIDEAARRIAFAMNSALADGKVIEGQFTEVLPEPVKVDRRIASVEAAKTAGIKGVKQRGRPMDKPKSKLTKKDIKPTLPPVK